MNNLQNPVARKEGLVIQDSVNEVLVYDLSTNKAHCLNATAASVWRSCDGANSAEDIGALLAGETGAAVSAELVWLALQQLAEKDLLQEAPAISEPGLSRRELVRKIGLATVVALPVVASLAAPTAALASTSCACTNPGACITQSACPSTVNCNGSGVCAP